MTIRCNCCKKDYSPARNPFKGVIVFGWISEYTEKFIIEGKPVALAFCKECTGSGKVNITPWSSNATPIHVKSAPDSFIIDFVNPESDYPRSLGKTASGETDRKQADAAQSPETPPVQPKVHEAPPPPVAAKPAAAPAPAKPARENSPGGSCSVCKKEITIRELDKSLYVFLEPLCDGCYDVAAGDLVTKMKANEAAGRPVTEGLGEAKVVAYCACGGLVTADVKKASVMLYGRTMCKKCLDTERNKPAAGRTTGGLY